ncbi:MAG: hypothetical protein LBR47_02515 [Spirochaetaceae bacterium]|jgi:hypothetical protein|nr:hypothetical protein [Spirochaetaceae bacterium]
MKHILTALVILALFLPSLSAVDYGGAISNRSGTEGPFSDMGFEQENQITAWVRVPFDNRGKTEFAAEGMYRFTWTKEDGPLHILDMGLFKFHTSFGLIDNLSLRIDAGRFGISDITGLVFSQPSDGLRVAIESPSFGIAFYGGYTGLLNEQVVSIYTGEAEEKTDYPYSLAPAYIPAGISVRLPLFFMNQTFSSETFGFFDPRREHHRIYMTLGLNGPIVGRLYYVAAAVFGVDIEDGNMVNGASHLSKLELNYYPGFLSSSISLDGVFASGEFGRMNAFTPFTVVSVLPAAEWSMLYSGLLKTGLTFTIKPVDPLFCLAQAHLLFDMPGKGEYPSWGGWQWILSARYNLFSDLNLSLGAGQFIPKSGDSHFYLNLKAVIVL